MNHSNTLNTSSDNIDNSTMDNTIDNLNSDFNVDNNTCSSTGNNDLNHQDISCNNSLINIENDSNKLLLSNQGFNVESNLGNNPFDDNNSNEFKEGPSGNEDVTKTLTGNRSGGLKTDLRKLTSGSSITKLLSNNLNQDSNVETPLNLTSNHGTYISSKLKVARISSSSNLRKEPKTSKETHNTDISSVSTNVVGNSGTSSNEVILQNEIELFMQVLREIKCFDLSKMTLRDIFDFNEACLKFTMSTLLRLKKLKVETEKEVKKKNNQTGYTDIQTDHLVVELKVFQIQYMLLNDKDKRMDKRVNEIKNNPFREPLQDFLNIIEGEQTKKIENVLKKKHYMCYRSKMREIEVKISTYEELFDKAEQQLMEYVNNTESLKNNKIPVVVIAIGRRLFYKFQGENWQEILDQTNEN
ncbi:hypothetical protein ABK040_012087 [Willaertia magna]